MFTPSRMTSHAILQIIVRRPPLPRVSIGVAVIAFRCRLCKRQGRGILLIAGPKCVQRAFEEAGVIDRLPFQEDVLAARRLTSRLARKES